MMAAAMVLVVAIPVGLASAQTNNVVGVGITNCAGAWTGKITFAPPLRNGGVAVSETVRIKAKAKPCVGGVPLPAKGALSGSATVNAAGANNCALLLPLPPAAVVIPVPFLETIKWTPGIIHFSQIAFPSETVTSTVPAATVNFSGTGPTVAGSSFPMLAATQSINTVKTWAVITGAAPGNCGNASGLSNLMISFVGTTGTY